MITSATPPRARTRRNPIQVVKESVRELLKHMAELGISQDHAKKSVGKNFTPPLEDAVEILREEENKSNKKEEGW